MRKYFGGLFSGSLNEYGNKFIPILKAFLFLYFIPVLVFAVIFLIILSIVGISIDTTSVDFSNFFFGGDTLSALYGPALIVIFVAIVLIIMILTLLLNITYIDIAFRREKVSFSRSFGVARRFFWRYLGLTILVTIFLIILYILLIIPGIIFTVYWIFASYILIRENTGIMEALRRSKRLVRYRWWRVFGYIILVTLISMIVYFVTGLIPFIGGFIPMLLVTPFVILFLKNFYLALVEEKTGKVGFKPGKKIAKRVAKKPRRRKRRKR